MKTTSSSLLTSLFMLAIGFAGAAHAAPVTFDWATIGDPGNADDIHGAGFGGVATTYRISKTEVTNAQYVEFLNAVAATDTNALYSSSMGSNSLGGITRSGSPGSYTYTVKADSIGNGPGGADGEDYTYGDKPVVFVSFFDAMRFTNWLENGQPTGAQDASTTEAGVYNIGSGADEVRTPNATYFLPSEDEWYKAAYYDPNKSGGAGYYDYPTSTDLLADLDNNLPSSDTGNSVNFFLNDEFTTGSISYPLTDVGAYTASVSPYGTFDQNGNVWEWNEGLINASARGIRGGSWGNLSSFLNASSRIGNLPSGETVNLGFRVASIPEPSTLLLGALASVGLLMRRRRLS